VDRVCGRGGGHAVIVAALSAIAYAHHAIRPTPVSMRPAQNEGMKTWLRDIERATNEREVVANARDYVSLWSPRELPDGCQEIQIQAEEDISHWRERIASGCATMAGRQGAERLRDLVAFLSRASERLGELQQRQD
jgi:hypothetical protein